MQIPPLPVRVAIPWRRNAFRSSARRPARRFTAARPAWNPSTTSSACDAMLRFHPLAISDRRAIADDAVAITFAVPAALREDYRFRAGQHLALRARIGGSEERRTYSIVNPEGASSLTIGVRVHPAGRMSRHLAQSLAIGDVVDVMTPNGSFNTQPTGKSRLCAAFAAGSGITPVLSIVATVLASEPASRFQLYYGNTHTARTMFLEEVHALKDRYL